MPAIIRKKKSKKFLVLIILILGVLLIVSGSYLKIRQKYLLSFNVEPPTYNFIANSPPISIRIRSVNIFLVVSEGSITDGIWSISESGANHLNVSGNPGDGGNIVIYGHNKKNLFGPIRNIKVGDLVEINSEIDKKYYYRVEKTAVVKPEEIDYVLPKDTEILTLYTCTGFMDSKRFVAVATPDQSL